jgi:hypothetical protein
VVEAPRTVNATTTDNWSDPMKHVSTGAGLCALAAAVAGFPIINGLASTERTAQASPAAAGAIAAAAMTQAEPTIVWYGISPAIGNNTGTSPGFVFRAWSSGLIEYRIFNTCGNCTPACGFIVENCVWRVFSSPTDGLASRADINADLAVDGKDLASVLSAWGEAVPQGIPPSDCPLNLINP